ncbi:MAG: gamma subclass chorismate mutase AroQ [Pseudomonadales bacterium]
MKRLLWNAVLVTALLVFALAPPQAAVADGDSLYELIGKRLELMQVVAAHKWHHGLPIEDLEREALVIEQAAADALRHGLRVDASRAFFAAQIDAAKEIQAYWHGVWQQGSGPAAAADLDTQVRPELLRLGAEILAAARRNGTSVGASAGPTAALEVVGMSASTAAALAMAARDLQPYAHRLQQILHSGVLRVGTTGDYPPFSYRGDADAHYQGVDIDLARDLAAALDVAVEFVPTSWPTLLDDLVAGHYDIGMSGISRTLARQRLGYQSLPYFADGKTPIARCDAAARLGSLADIDRPGVRVVVNPGGTNEAFVDANIRQADKLLHPDNRTIFQLLLEGAADVMITDRVEVGLQTALHPALCATMSDNLSYHDKAYLMPQDDPWRAFVDTWLALARGSGVVADALQRHGVQPNPPRGP